jgi:hypothetical protein
MRVLMKMFPSRRKKATAGLKNCRLRTFIFCGIKLGLPAASGG